MTQIFLPLKSSSHIGPFFELLVLRVISKSAAFFFLPFVKIGVAIRLWKSTDIVGFKMSDGVDSFCMWKFRGPFSSFGIFDFFLECGGRVEFDAFESIGCFLEVFLFLISDELHADGAEVEFFIVVCNGLRISALFIWLIDARHGIVVLLVWFLGQG